MSNKRFRDELQSFDFVHPLPKQKKQKVEKKSVIENIQNKIDRYFDNIPGKSTGRKIRENFVTHLSETLLLQSDDAVKIEKIARGLEQTLYDRYFALQPNIYTQKARAIIRAATKDPKRFIDLDDVSYVATANFQEIANDYQDVPIVKETSKYEHIFKADSEVACRKCRSKDTGYEERQLCGADESATVFYRKLFHFQCYCFMKLITFLQIATFVVIDGRVNTQSMNVQTQLMFSKEEVILMKEILNWTNISAVFKRSPMLRRRIVHMCNQHFFS